MYCVSIENLGFEWIDIVDSSSHSTDSTNQHRDIYKIQCDVIRENCCVCVCVYLYMTVLGILLDKEFVLW